MVYAAVAFSSTQGNSMVACDDALFFAMEDLDFFDHNL